MNTKKMTFAGCCYCYLVSGTAVLVVGTILPSIMSEAGLSFTAAGGLLSMMAVGNFLASFLFPPLSALLGKRLSIVLTTLLVPVSFFVLTMLPPVAVMYLLMFAAGLSRGCITIVNNMTVNLISNNSSKALNLLHSSFAVGAFVTPFATAMMINQGMGWRNVLYVIMFLCVTSAVSYALMDYGDGKSHTSAEISKAKDDSGMPASAKTENRGFLTNAYFYCLCFLLFFYVGTENCINGWFVTYLQSTGIMSETYATSMVSVTWLVILIGRLVCASLSSRVEKDILLVICTAAGAFFFFLLIFSKNLPAITAAQIGLGFFLSAIYPTGVADAGQYMGGSTLGMSMITAISALGGIITPQLIGMAADHIGIVAAISMLGSNALVMVVFAIINAKKHLFPLLHR